jgi:hypothetical protein
MPPKALEAAEAVITKLLDLRGRIVVRIEELAGERRVASYHALINSDSDAFTRLDRFHEQQAQLDLQLGDVDLALAEARDRMVAAQEAVARGDASRRARCAGELLVSLESVAVVLDGGHGTDRPPHVYSAAPTGELQRRRYYGNPAAQVECGRLMGELVACLRSLGLGGNVEWPPTNWAVMHRSDLWKALEKAIAAYQNNQIASRQRNSFVELLRGFVAVVQRDLQRIANEPEVAA